MIDPQKLHQLEVIDRELGEKGGLILADGEGGEIFMPASEISDPGPDVGQTVIVALLADPDGDMIASMKLDKWILETGGDFEEGDPVTLLVVDVTDLGFKCVMNDRYWGVVYKNEVFQWLQYGEVVQGFVKKIREDGKYDLTLKSPGHRAAQDEIGPKILAALERSGGFLAIHDKSEPEIIYQTFGASKKKFKIALGGLYKKRLISIHDDGIRLVKRK